MVKNQNTQKQNSKPDEPNPFGSSKGRYIDKKTKILATGGAALFLAAGATKMIMPGQAERSETPASPPANILYEGGIEKPDFIKPTKPVKPLEVPEKYDDGVLPGSGVPADQDKGIPDVAGSVRPVPGESPPKTPEPGIPTKPPEPEVGPEKPPLGSLEGNPVIPTSEQPMPSMNE